MVEVLTRVGHIVAAAGLLLMAWLQLNDADPAYWTGVYAVAAIVPLLRLMGWSDLRLWWLTAGLISAGLLISGSGFVQFLGNYGISDLFASMQVNPDVEAAREFLGLIIALVIIFPYRGN